MYIMLRYKNIEDKITDMTNLAITAALNSKTSEVINEIPSITNLATNASLNDKINEVKNLVLLTELLLLLLVLLKIKYLMLVI